MKKSILLILCLMLTVLLAACDTEPEADPVSDSYYIGEEAAVMEFSSVELYTDGYTDLCFSFRMLKDTYDYLIAQTDGAELYGIMDASGSDALPLLIEEGGTVTEAGEEYYLFLAYVGGTLSENYDTEYTAVVGISFEDEGTNYDLRAASESATIFEVALREYCDRSDTESEAYPYPCLDGSYTPYEDLSAHLSIICSRLHLTLTEDGVSDNAESVYFSSPYEVSWFDGVLTVRMKNGTDINPNILDRIYVNGENEYFEIHEGIIRLVVNP